MALRGAGTCSIANISRLRTQIINGSGITNSGLDFAANYRTDIGDGALRGTGVT